MLRPRKFRLCMLVAPTRRNRTRHASREYTVRVFGAKKLSRNRVLITADFHVLARIL